MGERKSRRYCPEHGWILAVQQTPNHVLHLLLSVVTVGFWIPVWLVLIVLSSERRPICPVCGGPTRQHERPARWFWQRRQDNRSSMS